MIAAFTGMVDSPVSVKTRGGEILVVHFEIEGKKVKKVFFEGDVHIIYEGEMWEEALLTWRKNRSDGGGAAGRMGGRIIHVIQEAPSIGLFRAVERSDHPAIGWDIGEIIGLGKLGISLEGSLKNLEGMWSLILPTRRPPWRR